MNLYVYIYIYKYIYTYIKITKTSYLATRTPSRLETSITSCCFLLLSPPHAELSFDQDPVHTSTSIALLEQSPSGGDCPQ